MMIAKLAANAGKGLLAGMAGTVAMTVSSTLEAKLRDRGSSNTPAEAAAKVLQIAQFASDEAEARFGTIVHWSYGTAWGAARGLFGSVLPPTGADAAHFATVWGTEQLMLPGLGVAPPSPQWGATEIAVDAWHHLVYAVATGIAYRALDRG